LSALTSPALPWIRLHRSDIVDATEQNAGGDKPTHPSYAK
jgi:hypothetical protein